VNCTALVGAGKTSSIDGLSERWNRCEEATYLTSSSYATVRGGAHPNGINACVVLLSMGKERLRCQVGMGKGIIYYSSMLHT
jgi:hypothetical protein